MPYPDKHFWQLCEDVNRDRPDLSPKERVQLVYELWPDYYKQNHPVTKEEYKDPSVITHPKPKLDFEYLVNKACDELQKVNDHPYCNCGPKGHDHSSLDRKYAIIIVKSLLSDIEDMLL